MKNTYFVVLFVLIHIGVLAKGRLVPQWGNLVMGKYAVGYKDTIIFKSDEQFQYNGYHGPKPFFVSIWYPAAKKSSAAHMLYKNYFDYAGKGQCSQVYDSVIDLFSKITINDGVCINISKTGGDVPFETDQKNLYHDIMSTVVAARHNSPALPGRFPCIFYHHGHVSTPFDNNVFCEFMASHGYVVVSAFYELSRVNKAVQLSMDAYQQNTISDLTFMLKVTKGMPNVDTTKMVAAGHSWGAQSELKFDNIDVKKPFRKIISFHTTMEDKNLETIKEGWPDFTYMVENKCLLSTTPAVLFAPFQLGDMWDTDTVTGKETFLGTDTLYPKFRVFRCNKTTPYTFVTVQHNVRHDGFITLGNLRMPYIDKYKLADKKEIISQQYYYEQIVLLVKEILTAELSELPKQPYELKNTNFKIESVNFK